MLDCAELSSLAFIVSSIPQRSSWNSIGGHPQSRKAMDCSFNISVQSHSLLSSELLSAIPLNLLVAKMSLEQGSSCFDVTASTKPSYTVYVFVCNAKTCQSVLHLWVQGRCSSVRSTRAGNSEACL